MCATNISVYQVMKKETDMASKDNVTTSAPIPVAPVQHKDETRKAGFWISQLFVLLATVIGVYLASSQGFKQALAYGEAQATRTNYYLRQSLRNELESNLAPVRDYLTAIASGSASSRNQPIALETFIMDCLRNSPATLETPSELLSESRKFHRDVEDIQKKIANQFYALGEGKDKMEAVLAHMEKDVLPKFDADLRALKNRLDASGIAVR